MSDFFPLQCLRAGEAAVVAHVNGPAEAVHRLKELGLHDGADLEMVQVGSPCILKIRGHRLAVRLDADVTILVRQPLPLGATA